MPLRARALAFGRARKGGLAGFATSIAIAGEPDALRREKALAALSGHDFEHQAASPSRRKSVTSTPSQAETVFSAKSINPALSGSVILAKLMLS
jgi:hypothetical protein